MAKTAKQLANEIFQWQEDMLALIQKGSDWEESYTDFVDDSGVDITSTVGVSAEEEAVNFYYRLKDLRKEVQELGGLLSALESIAQEIEALAD